MNILCCHLLVWWRSRAVGKLELEKIDAWIEIQLCLPLGDGCFGRVWRVWVPCQTVVEHGMVRYGSHVRVATGRDQRGHRSPRSASAALKNFQTLLKALTNVGGDIKDGAGLWGVAPFTKLLKNKIRRDRGDNRRCWSMAFKPIIILDSSIKTKTKKSRFDL